MYVRLISGCARPFKLSFRLLETADQAFMGHIIYYYAISNFGQWGVLLKAAMLWCVTRPAVRASHSLNRSSRSPVVCVNFFCSPQTPTDQHKQSVTNPNWGKSFPSVCEACGKLILIGPPRLSWEQPSKRKWQVLSTSACTFLTCQRAAQLLWS